LSTSRSSANWKKTLLKRRLALTTSSAAFAKYFDTTHGEYEAGYSAIGLANRQYGSPEGTLKFKSSVPDYKKNAIVHASFIGKYQFAQTLDRHTAGITLKL
jgi:hypothetical protein